MSSKIKEWRDQLKKGLNIIYVGNMPPHGYKILIELLMEMDTYVQEEEKG